MSRYSDQIRDEYGRTIPGVSVYVYVWDAEAQVAGDLESLTDDLSASLANPVISDTDGVFYFNSVDGQKLLEYHYGGKVQERSLILVGKLPVPQAVFGGLFVNANALMIPAGMDMIGTDGRSVLDVGGANYVAGTKVTPESGFTSANSRNFRLSKEQEVTPQLFGALADGVTDDSAAFVAAIAYLKTFALNTGGSGFYKGSPELFIPAGHYYLGTTTLDINHTLVISGEGSGRFGPEAGGCTRLRWAAGANGIRIQHPNTSGNTTVDVTTHDGAGGVFLAHMCLEGGYAGTEGEYHGLVCRGITTGEDLYIKSWPGEGLKGLAGNQTGGGTLGGNFSVSCFTHCRFEGNRIGSDVRGADANVVTFVNCEAYQNRQAGFIDDNGAGSNTYIGCHAASNGLVTGTWPQTQCSSGGNRYAAKWGGDFTVAPSGTTADTANWFYIEAGAAITNLIPAHTATANTFRAGGDYLTINSATATFVNPYSEVGGFSQFTVTTVVEGGAISDQYYRGGTRRISRQDGYRVHPPTGTFRLQKAYDGTEAIFAAEDNSSVIYGYWSFINAQGAYGLAPSTSGYNFRVGTYASYTTPFTVQTDGIRSTGVVLSSGAGGVGYATGAGAAVTQLTNKSTATPAINKVCGQVTMNNAALGAGAKVSFVVTNSAVAATDTIIVSVASGGTANAYRAAVTAISAGVSFTITVENITAGSLSEAPVINFAIIKAVAA